MKLLRKCPICNCNEGEKLYEMNFAKSQEEIIPKHYDIVACNNCGFIFNNTNWKQKDYDKYYSETTKYSNNFTSGAGGISQNDLKKYNYVIGKIKNIINKDSSIIDIGCAKGGLLQTLKNRGYNNLYGIEASNDAIKNLKKYNIDGKSISIFNIKNINKKFDVVILTQVLEHIYDLAFIKNIIYDILNENGILYIDIPDSTSYIINKLNSYYYFDLEHINHFSTKTLEYLFDNLSLIETGNVIFDNVSNIKAYTIYGIFQKNNNIKKIHKIKDISSINKMIEYINYSNKTDKYNITNIDNTKSTYCWGFGAYLRRLLLDDRYFNNIKISGIIDKNESFKGMKILNYKNDEIPIFTPDIINNNNDANIILTSVLYSEQIENDLINNKNFIGKIYKLRAEQSRAEQSRAEQSRAEHRYLIITAKKQHSIFRYYRKLA